MISYFQAIVIGLIQGVTELFPISSRTLSTPDERLAFLIVVATIPVGVIGLAFEHALRTVFAKPLAAAIFLTMNGVLLAGGEWVRRRNETAQQRAAIGRRLETLDVREAGVIGVAQSAALFAGISRSGITMIAGLARGLDHEDAARFSFLLATPVILAAGLLKIPSLFGPLGDGVRGQALAGAVAAAIAAYAAVRFLVRFFKTHSLIPFAIYCLIAGGLSIIRFA